MGRTTGHTRGRITAVEVDAVAVQYDGVVHRFDDQIEIEGRSGAFSAGGDSGSVIWRSRDRAPLALLFAGSATGGSARRRGHLRESAGHGAARCSRRRGCAG